MIRVKLGRRAYCHHLFTRTDANGRLRCMDCGAPVTPPPPTSPTLAA